MEDTGPRSAACYHDQHDQCSGPKHCGCACHRELKEGVVPSPEDKLKQKIYSLEDDKAFLKTRIEFLEAKLSNEMERNVKYVSFISGLRRGDCWCEVGIGNPNAGGDHSAICREIQETFK